MAKRFPMPPRPAQSASRQHHRGTGGEQATAEQMESAADLLEEAMSALRAAAALWREADTDQYGRWMTFLRISSPVLAAGEAIQALYAAAPGDKKA